MNNTQIANQLYDKYGKGIDRDSYRKSISRLIKRIVEEQQTETPSEPQPQQRKTPVKSLPKEQPQQQSNLKQTTVVTTEILKAIGIQQQEPEFSEAELRADIEQLRKNNSNNTNDHNYDDLKF
jgi:hypothetical protein